MSAAKHIIVLQNGLNGHHWSMHSMATYLRQKLSAENFVVVISDVNNIALTYFGIEPCGRRLRDFVLQQCRLHPLATHISFIGHSLGGVMIRYCIGLLQEDGFFGSDRSLMQMQPVMYVSIASPHLGVHSLDALRQTLARWAIPKTGTVLLLEDDEKLLLNMSLALSKYMLGLQRFQLFAYGNLVGDTLVPMDTACLCDGSAQLFAVDSDASAACMSADDVEVGQLVRVVSAAAATSVGDDGDASSNTAPAICSNLRRLPWNSYAVNLKGYLVVHNAICNNGIYQTLGLSRSTVVLDHIARCLCDTTGTPMQQAAVSPSDARCVVM